MICSLHQPSSRVVGELDALLILSQGGGVVYTGRRASLSLSLVALGKPPPAGMGPVEFLLDVATGEEEAEVNERAPLEEEARRRMDAVEKEVKEERERRTRKAQEAKEAPKGEAEGGSGGGAEGAEGDSLLSGA